MLKNKISATKRGTTISRRSTKRHGKTRRTNRRSSSSSSSSSSTVSLKTQQEASEEEEERNDLLDTLYDTDNESINEEEEPEYTLCLPLQDEINFFELFGDIPDVDNLSDDITIASIIIEQPEVVEEDVIKDKGKFVDPLTGGDMRSSEDSKSTDEVEAAIVNDQIEEDKLEDVVSFDSNDLVLPDETYDEDYDNRKVSEADVNLEKFMELKAIKEVGYVEDIDWEAVARELEAKRVEQHTLEFITELFNQAVEMVEYVSPETILRHNLDKHLLMQELHSKVPILKNDRFVLQFLYRKAIEHFRRKKSFRPIMPDNPKTVAHEIYKYEYATGRLDKLLDKETKLKRSTSELIKNLQNEYEQAKEEAEKEVQLFASMVKTNLFRENNPKINAIVELLLTRMNRYRNEVNEVRFEMLTKLHYKARLTQALSELEDLGNGLSMRDFGSLQAETQTMGKKIEERNAELEKLHIRCHSDIHTMAHYKEKQKVLRNVILTQKSVLQTVVHDKYSMREKLHDLKLKHKNVRDQIRDLSFQGGLLDKPVLMMDYDATIERLNKQTATVEGLKKKLLATQNKIDKIMKNFTEFQKKNE